MNRKLLIPILCSMFALVFANPIQAQSTFGELYDIMQEKCVGCHGGDTPQGSLDLSGSQGEVYDLLVDANPVNPSAMSKGWKRIRPGYVEDSYMLQKLSNSDFDYDNTFSLEQADGDVMPPAPLDPLSHKEIELFRQWVLHGAPMNGEVIDPQILEDYYENGMALPTTDQFPAPAAGEGVQIKLGPIFLQPLEEKEFFKTHAFDFGGNLEVPQFDIRFNNESHHFLLYKVGEGIQFVPEGIRDLNETSFSMIENDLVAAWQNNGAYILPETTAFKFDPDDVFDLNYHVKNYSSTGILATNVYLNVYTQETGIAEREMFSTLLPINLFETFLGEPIGNGLEIPNDGDEYTFTDHVWIPDFPGLPFPAGDWHIWQLSTHTHSRGVDYDIYLGENGGQKGEQVYEGFYNFDYTFNQGYYDNAHPAVKVFDPLLQVDMSYDGGLVHEAVYVNDEAETLYWGDTTDDEMMLLFVYFTDGPLLLDSDEVDLVETNNFEVYPNPFVGQTNIRYTLKQGASVQLEVFNVLGEKISTLVNEQQGAGNHQEAFGASDLNLPNGMYIIQLTIDGQTSTQKVVEMK